MRNASASTSLDASLMRMQASVQRGSSVVTTVTSLFNRPLHDGLMIEGCPEIVLGSLVGLDQREDRIGGDPLDRPFNRSSKTIRGIAKILPEQAFDDVGNELLLVVQVVLPIATFPVPVMQDCSLRLEAGERVSRQLLDAVRDIQDRLDIVPRRASQLR